MRPLAIRLIIALFLLCPTTALAQLVDCGSKPEFPPDVDQSIKGDIQVSAQLLTKYLGDAALKGKVDINRKELQQKYSNIDRAKIDQYLLWVSCQNIMRDSSSTTEQKSDRFIQVYLKMTGILLERGTTQNSAKSEPWLAVRFKGDDIWIVNEGAPEENLSVSFIAMAWIWIYGPPADKGCTLDYELSKGLSRTEALAVNSRGTSDGVIQSSDTLVSLRKLSELVRNNPEAIKAELHSCNYVLRYSISVSYNDRAGTLQRRFYQVMWSRRRAPETRDCHKINEQRFAEAVAARDLALRAGSVWTFDWAFNNAPTKVGSLVTLLARERGTEELFDGDTERQKRVIKLLYPNGFKPQRACEG
jgi:hypothetical protein